MIERYFQRDEMGNESIDHYYKILNILEENPDLSQRKIANELGYSLGKVNYVIAALVEKGILKLQKFIKSRNKLGYRYVLTPKGITEKYHITKTFLSRKTEEYNMITVRYKFGK